MKSFKVLFLVMVSGVLISLSGCKKPDPTPPTVEEEQLTKLSQTWKIKEAKLDGVVKDYTGFTLILNGTPGAASFGYTVTGRPSTSPWPASGQWTFGADPLSDIIRDPSSTADKLDMKYSVTDTQLNIGFTFGGTGYNARTSVVKGAWTYTFDKQ